MSNKNQTTLSYFISILFILTSLILCIELLCFNTSFMNFIQSHITLFDKSITEYIGIDNDELIKLDDATLNVILGKEYDEAIINKYMSEKEIMHLIDCNELNNKALFVLGISATVLVISIVMFVKKKCSVNLLYTAFKKSVIGTFFVFLFLILFAAIDFYTFWTTFHNIVFPGNDRWLLSYSSDVLLMMVPQQFFEVLVGSIIFLFIIVIICALIILRNIRKKIYD